MILLITKKKVGRLRPHFIDVCKPDFSKVVCTIPAQVGFVYRSIDTGGTFCTGDASAVKEARLSFPSGHSSYSSYTMLFLIIYVEARLFLLQLRYIKPLIQLAAFAAAFVTMMSRISDYHHRGSDVVGGSVLGEFEKQIKIVYLLLLTFFHPNLTNFLKKFLKFFITLQILLKTRFFQNFPKITFLEGTKKLFI